MGTFGDPWAPLGAYGGLWGPMGAYGDLLAPLGTYGHLWGPMGSMGGYGHLFFLPPSVLTHFPHFPIMVFKVFFYSCIAMFLIVQGGSPMIFQLCPPFLFFSFGGG